ncbi:MAG: murein biosynthesis integral membrane protein MurJ [Alphaproteobacteria bacterium]|nr:murein biosynthesis integral membrane protein MurJ [Alphaproteobacteria bacterium]HCP00125.1 murein biosynthesis integral membrane protein MurJ [Rhodospirillaceae bacterium]
MPLIRAIATVGGWTMVSRVLGFVRDMFIAAFLGAGQVSDAFFVALQLPNIFRRLFAEGAFNAAFVPLFAGELTEHGRAAARAFGERVFGFMLLILIVLSVLVEVFMPQVMTLVAGGFVDEPEKFQLAVHFARLTFPYLLFVSLAAMLGGILNTLEKFVAAAAAPILLNTILIGALTGVALGWLPDPGLALSWGVLIAGIGQFAWLGIACSRTGLMPVVPRLVFGPRIKRLFVLMGPGILGAGVYQINVLVGMRLASELPEGSVSFLYFADRVNQLPLGVIGAAVSVALLPLLSRQIRAGDMAAARDSQNRAIEFSMLLTLPAAAALLVIADPIVTVLFQRGAFNGGDAGATAAALTAFALGLPAYVLIKALAPGFFAREDTASPVKVAVFALVVNVGLALALMPTLAHVGIALATAISAWLNAGVLAILLYRRGLLDPDRKLISRVGRAVIAAALMAICLWFTARMLAAPLAKSDLAGIVALAALVLIGLAVFVGIAQLLRAAPFNEISSMLRRR